LLGLIFPPAASIRSLSSGKLGTWSRDRGTALKVSPWSFYSIIALESPTLAETSLSFTPQINMPVEPLMSLSSFLFEHRIVFNLLQKTVKKSW